MLTGVVVWGLIIYASIRYRRRSEADIPVQTRYNLPIEIFYTIAPVVMVVVFFYFTVQTQNDTLNVAEDPDQNVTVVGQQWSWTFNYTGEEAVDSQNVYTSGTASNIPTLYLPVNETTRFNLHSPDVVHNFGIPGFLMRMDVIPGRVNHYAITPTRTGEYAGKCYELCGVYHQRMLFNVRVVSSADYEAHLQDLEAAGRVSEEPLLGGADARTQAGLGSSEEGGQE
jgi:cytochrome c oxidase subunit 2